MITLVIDYWIEGIHTFENGSKRNDCILKNNLNWLGQLIKFD